MLRQGVMCNIYGVERRVVSRSTMVVNTFFLGCYNYDAVLVPFGNRDECQVISKLTQAVHPVAVVIPGGVAIEKVAELRGLEAAQIAEASWANASRFFKIPN